MKWPRREVKLGTTGTMLPDLESAVHAYENLEIRLWLRLLSCVSLMEMEIRARLRTTFAITIAQFEVLAQLYRVQTGGLTMKALSAQLMVSKGNVTGLINRLQDAGLISRHRMPADRRSQVIRLTVKGRRLFDAMRPLHNQWFCNMMRGLTRQDMKQLHDLLKILKTNLISNGRALHETVRCGNARHMKRRARATEPEHA